MNKSVKKVKTNTMVFTIVLSLLLIFAYKINFATTEKKFEHYIFFAVTKDSTDVSLQDLSRGFLYESFRGGIIFDVDQRTHDVQGNPVNTLLLLIPVFIIIVSIIEKKKDLKSRVALADFKLLLSIIYLIILSALMLGALKYMQLSIGAYLILVVSILLVRTCLIHGRKIKRAEQEESSKLYLSDGEILHEQNRETTVEAMED